MDPLDGHVRDGNDGRTALRSTLAATAVMEFAAFTILVRRPGGRRATAQDGRP